MFSLSRQHQLIVGALLVMLMVVTRGHHFASVSALPSASWAVFFLAGFYLSSRLIFPALLGLAAALDFSAIFWGGVSSYCVSPAYGFLLPAYGSLWLAGRWYASKYQFSVTSALLLAASVILAAAVATGFSSGGFYWFSGRYTEPTFVEFGQRFIQYFPKYLGTLSFYVAVAAVVHIAFRLSHLGQQTDQHKQS
jgi:uncharacterized membrane-anchored protein YitT (DUF2179 family)